MVNFSENCEQDVWPPYLDTLISKLLTLLQRGERLVQARAAKAPTADPKPGGTPGLGARKRSMPFDVACCTRLRQAATATDMMSAEPVAADSGLGPEQDVY